VAAQPAIRVELASLGASRRLAIRKLLTLFRIHGWRDVNGAAISIVDHLARGGGHASARSLAQAVPRDFFAHNGLSRAELRRALEELGEHVGSAE
jgi:hypothetical protein